MSRSLKTHLKTSANQRSPFFVFRPFSLKFNKFFNPLIFSKTSDRMISEVKGGITSTPGFRAAGVEVGLKAKGPDLLLLASERGPVPAAGLFTSNLIKGFPLLVTQEHLKDGKLGAIVANSGCANSYTGEEGLRNAREMAALVAKPLDLSPEDVGVASTGLIGTRLPMDRIRGGIKKALKELSNSWEAGTKAARAIMTTDTQVKEIAVEVEVEDGSKITIGGVAKGAGMIHPDLHATMLAFITTDAFITPAGLRTALQKSADRSFNMISIDRDTSTSDMVLAMSNGLAGNERITKKHPNERFQAGLDYVTTKFARMIASDGEGATRMVEVCVRGAKSEKDARLAARAVVGSNLVKTAIHGSDPNWGRIIAALGRSNASFDPANISLSIGSQGEEAQIVREGSSPTNKDLNHAENLLKEKEIKITINLGNGVESATAWGCDLSEEYVEINSRYTT